MHTSNTSIAVLVAWIVATLCQAFVSRAEFHIKVTGVDRVIFVPFMNYNLWLDTMHGAQI